MTLAVCALALLWACGLPLAHDVARSVVPGAGLPAATMRTVSTYGWPVVLVAGLLRLRRMRRGVARGGNH